jgi:carbonic anhydrase/acetyltransferase-like protein (isoleucine patch superfamily)
MNGIVRKYRGIAPRFGQDVYLAPTAAVVGDVELGDEVSVWYGAILRGDVGHIRIGRRTNVQDLACIHMSRDISHADIADHVTIGHNAVIHGARIGTGALIGIGSILLDNAVIGEECLVAAGSLVPADFNAPPRVLVRGSPAKVVRDLSEEEWTLGRRLAERYVGVARDHEREDA